MGLKERRSQIKGDIDKLYAVLPEHAAQAKRLIDEAKTGDEVQAIYAAIYRLSAQNLKVAMQENCSFVEAARRPSEQLDHFLAMVAASACG